MKGIKRKELNRLGWRSTVHSCVGLWQLGATYLVAAWCIDVWQLGATYLVVAWCIAVWQLGATHLVHSCVAAWCHILGGGLVHSCVAAWCCTELLVIVVRNFFFNMLPSQ